LLKSNEFEQQFVSRFAQLLNTTFQPDTILPKIAEFTELYEKDIDRHINRWQFPRSHDGWLGDINYTLNTFVNSRPCYMQDFILEFFDLEEDEFDFNCHFSVPETAPNKLLIAPNPASTFFNIKIENPGFTECRITIFDYVGRSVYHENLSISNGSINKTVDISNLKNGMYLVVLSDGINNFSNKLIKSSH
jgi:hypothetical protein